MLRASSADFFVGNRLDSLGIRAAKTPQFFEVNDV
jgi:hypothetical protein